MSKKYFFEEVVAQADDPIYQNQQIVIMSGVGPTKPKNSDEDDKNDPRWMEDEKRFKTPSEEMEENMELHSQILARIRKQGSN